MKENTLLDMSNEDYHSDNGYKSSSQLKDALKGRVGYYNKYILKNIKQKDVPAFAVGTAAHTLLLEPELYDKEIAVFNGVRRGVAFEAFKLENPNKTIISPLEETRVQSWVKAVRKNKLAMPLFKGGIAEKSIFTEINGQKVKARFDYMHTMRGFISDLKTTSGKLDEKSIRNKVYAFGYHISAALYMDVINPVVDNTILDFYLVFVSKDTLEVKVVKLHESMIEEGRQEYLKGIEEVKIIHSEDFVCKEEVLVLKSDDTKEEW